MQENIEKKIQEKFENSKVIRGRSNKKVIWTFPRIGSLLRHEHSCGMAQYKSNDWLIDISENEKKKKKNRENRKLKIPNIENSTFVRAMEWEEKWGEVRENSKPIWGRSSILTLFLP